jgi:purine-binding chemotaxis protein CheW
MSTVIDRPATPTAAPAARPVPGVGRLPSRLQAAGGFLSFRLGGEAYGIDILKVQEIRSCESATHLVQAPRVVKGVVNLRGVIVPLVDLRLHFGLDPAADTELTVVIVLTVAQGVVGIVVDAVDDVLQLGQAQILPAPAFNTSVGGAFITGIGSAQDRLLILLDIEAVIGSAEIGLSG